MQRFLSNQELTPFVSAHVHGAFSLRALSGGLLNQSALIEAGRQRLLLKVYRDKMDNAAVAETHRLMAFVAARGIPVPLPVAVGEVGGRVVALYPFVAGVHPPKFNDPYVEVMGGMLGRIDAVLDGFRPSAPKPLAASLSRAQDVPGFLREMDEVRAQLHVLRPSDRAYIGRCLDDLAWAVREVPWQETNTDDLPVRVCHNDFHSYNVLMRGGRITAVLDWEKAGWQFRGFEAMRSVIFNCRSSWRKVDGDSADAYLRAYARHVRLSVRERETAFVCGLREMTFSLWAVREYLRGHAAVRANIRRRTAVVRFLAAHREAFAERVARALTRT